MSNEHIEREIANLHILMEEIKREGRRTPTGLVIRHPAAEAVTVGQWQRYQDTVESRLVALERALEQALLCLDSIAGMTSE